MRDMSSRVISKLDRRKRLYYVSVAFFIRARESILQMQRRLWGRRHIELRGVLAGQIFVGRSCYARAVRREWKPGKWPRLWKWELGAFVGRRGRDMHIVRDRQILGDGFVVVLALPRGHLSE